MSLRVLLVEPVADDALFLGDVLAEIEAGRYWNNWVHIDALHASSWSEAEVILAVELVNLVLLDPDLSGSQGVETFRRIRALADRVPVILLLGAEDEAMGVRMIREGAQDFLLKKQVDCAPLAHAMRNAIERHRLYSAARAAAMLDPLTGLPNRPAFLTLADRDRKLAERLGRRLMLLVAEPANLAELAQVFGAQRRDLVLVETADRLRALAGATDWIACIGENRFCAVVLETGIETLEAALAKFHAAAVRHRIAIGAAVFDPQRPVSLDVLLEHASVEMQPVKAASV